MIALRKNILLFLPVTLVFFLQICSQWFNNNDLWSLITLYLYYEPLVSCGAVTNYHKLGGLKQQKFILSQFCSLVVQNQGVKRVVFSLEALGEKLFTLACSSFWWLPVFLGLCLHHSNLCLHGYNAFSSG